MQTITLNKAIDNLPEIIQKTISNFEETVIATDDGSVVIINQSDYNAMMETLNLLKDEKSLNALLEGHKQRKNGSVSGKNIDQVFNDL